MVLVFWNLSSNLFVSLEDLKKQLLAGLTGYRRKLYNCNCLEEDKLHLGCVTVEFIALV